MHMYCSSFITTSEREIINLVQKVLPDHKTYKFRECTNACRQCLLIAYIFITVNKTWFNF